MKKVIGIVLLVMVGLNLFAIVVRLSRSEAVNGSPMYFLVLLAMTGGGIWLINKSNQKKNKVND